MSLAFIAPGCGDDSRAHDAEVIQCRLDAFARAERPIVIGEFNAGRLGTVKQAKQWLVDVYLRDLGGNAKVSAAKKGFFFDANAKIIPWTRMTPAQRSAFDEWINSAQVQSRLGPRLERLFEHVKKTAKC